MVTESGPFTELNSRRLGPVRRFFVRRPRAMDAVVAAVSGLSVVTSDIGTGESRPLAVGLAFGVAGGGALMWRRSRPLAVTVVEVLLAALSLAATSFLGGLELAVACALYAVAVSRRPLASWLIASVACMAVVAAVWVWEQPSADVMERQADGSSMITDDRWGSAAGVLIVVLAAMAIGMSVRSRREHLNDLLERANVLARDRDRQTQLARAAERGRISREMHDVVAHSLSVMITLADGAASALERSPEKSREALTELSATGRAALGDMRRVLGALADDAPLEPTGDVGDLATLVGRFRTAGLPIFAEGLLTESPTDTGVRLALYRVVQESLTNVLRHAPGTARVDVSVRSVAARWEVTIVDHGAVVPAEESAGAGIGLVGMRERVELLGGSVEAGPTGQGWRVHVTIPREERRS